jgi:hypothetical protein
MRREQASYSLPPEEMIEMPAPVQIDSVSQIDDEAITVVAWRCDELRRAGYGPEDALLLAITPHVDLHLATDLVARGCPPAVAARVLL